MVLVRNIKTDSGIFKQKQRTKLIRHRHYLCVGVYVKWEFRGVGWVGKRIRLVRRGMLNHFVKVLMQWILFPEKNKTCHFIDRYCLYQRKTRQTQLLQSIQHAQIYHLSWICKTEWYNLVKPYVHIIVWEGVKSEVHDICSSIVCNILGSDNTCWLGSSYVSKPCEV